MAIFRKTSYFDAFVLSIFTILVTFHPYYLHGQINIFELGIYLPGINEILDGKIPYRDFFYLRGPFELYVPAFLMRFFGENIAVLSTYFYAGTVLTLLVCVFLARQILTTRLFCYLVIPVLVAKTFPRVVFTYWGGMRFALGLITIACGIQYFKSKKPLWLFISGIIAACSFWTSIEIGVYACIAIAATLIVCALTKTMDKRDFVKALALFSGGFLLIILSYSFYLGANNAFQPFLDATYTVVKDMKNTFPQVEIVPKNLMQAVLSMINPGSKNFRHLTPAYLYIFLAVYFLIKIRERQFHFSDSAVVCLAIYGFVFFVGSFRNVWSSNFEMVLQPEKILLFFLLERIFFYCSERKREALQIIQKQKMPAFQKRVKVYLINIFIAGVILSSIGYPIQRFNKRFFAFKFARNTILGKETESLKPLHDTEKIKLDMSRVKGMTVPAWQGEDFVELTRFFDSQTSPGDTVLMYPEGASYSFLVDRPFVGKFSMANFSWFSEGSHREYLKSLKESQAKFAVVPKTLPHYFERTHFIVDSNKRKYDEVMRYIEEHYELTASTPTLNILKRRTL